VLRQLPKQVSERVLVGLETPDDAGVYVLTAEHALIQTLDFFTPIVDDPYDYGQIAAANSLSDVYAMGGRPLTAMNIVCFPMEGIPDAPKECLVDILRGGADKVSESGALLLGGHTVNDETIKFGLSVTGIAPASEIVATRGARPGDDLVLTKAVGTGLVTTAIKRKTASDEDAAAAVASMKLLNAGAGRAMVTTGVHAATDVTGFGLLGHLFEMMDYSETAAELDSGAIPFLPGALRYAEDGVNTGGGKNNASYLGARVRFEGGVPEPVRVACFDPQTSGGLLISVAPERTARLLEELAAQGVEVRGVVGKVTAGPAGTILVR
jgi:selenide, water dikinase